MGSKEEGFPEEGYFRRQGREDSEEVSAGRGHRRDQSGQGGVKEASPGQPWRGSVWGHGEGPRFT